MHVFIDADACPVVSIVEEHIKKIQHSGDFIM